MKPGDTFACTHFSPASAYNAHVTFWGLFIKALLPCFLWGLGTAIGELPPYATSYAARKAGQADEEYQELTEDIKAGSSDPLTLTKKWMIKFLENRIGTNEALILKNTDLIVAKEIENDKRITIAKQADAADKEYRLQRGEITDCTLIHR